MAVNVIILHLVFLMIFSLDLMLIYFFFVLKRSYVVFTYYSLRAIYTEYLFLCAFLSHKISFLFISIDYFDNLSGICSDKFLPPGPFCQWRAKHLHNNLQWELKPHVNQLPDDIHWWNPTKRKPAQAHARSTVPCRLHRRCPDKRRVGAAGDEERFRAWVPGGGSGLSQKRAVQSQSVPLGGPLHW